MFNINCIAFSDVAHDCQKWDRPLDPYLLNMNSVVQMLKICLHDKCRCDTADVIGNRKA